MLEKDENGEPISWLRSKSRFLSDLAAGEARIIKINGKWTVHFKQRQPNGYFKYYKTDFIDNVSDDEDYSVNDELLKHITEMVQLEYAVRLDGKNYVLILSDKEADDFIASDEHLSECSAVYVLTAVLLTAEQEKKLKDNKISVFVIPDYYFENELLEVGER